MRRRERQPTRKIAGARNIGGRRRVQCTKMRVLPALLILGCLAPRTAFRCDPSDAGNACNAHPGEVCAASGYCAAPSPSCATGYAYTETSAWPGECVPHEPIVGEDASQDGAIVADTAAQGATDAAPDPGDAQVHADAPDTSGADAAVDAADVPRGCPPCDDHDPCTLDRCVDGVCAHDAMSGPCDDQNWCTTVDRCIDGRCVGGGAPLYCPQVGEGYCNHCEPRGGCTSTPRPTDGGSCPAS